MNVSRERIMSSSRHAGGVRRYHTWPVLREQRIDSHTWQVMRIYVEIFGPPRPEVWKWLLYHDVAEIGTGDVPSDVKAAYPEIKTPLIKAEEDSLGRLGVTLPQLTEFEFLRCKVCDVLERWEYGKEEVALGNQFAEPIVAGALKAALAKAEEMSGPDRMAVRRYVGG